MEKLTFTKYHKICKLEACHGVNLGSMYRNDVSVCEFVHYIAEAKCKEFLSLAKANVLSVLLNESTDAANTENDIILVVWCNTNGTEGSLTLVQWSIGWLTAP